MKPRADSYSIVIRGFWNRMIFSPQWVMNEIFHNQEIEKLVPIAPVAPLIYRVDQLALHIAEQQIIVQPRKFDANCIEQAEKMACEILTILPKTPVSAVGVNFGFLESDPNDEILKLFNFPDDIEIASLNWSIGTKKIVKKLTKDDITLNLTITCEPRSSILFDANFHFSVGSANDAAERINGHTVEMHNSLIKLFEDVYYLSEEEENNE